MEHDVTLNNELLRDWWLSLSVPALQLPFSLISRFQPQHVCLQRNHGVVQANRTSCICVSLPMFRRSHPGMTSRRPQEICICWAYLCYFNEMIFVNHFSFALFAHVNC